MSRSLTFRLETKRPWRQTPSRKKKAVVFTTVTTSACQNQLHAEFSKVCEIFKVCGIESLKCIREFYTPVCYGGDISTPRNVKLNETNCDWLFDMTVKRPHGRALANESCHLFQTFSRQSEGLATRDYLAGDYFQALHNIIVPAAPMVTVKLNCLNLVECSFKAKMY